MTCPNCKVEMEKGSLLFHGGRWIGVDEVNSSWRYKKVPMISSLLMKAVPGIPVSAYKCPNCGKIELYSELEKK